MTYIILADRHGMALKVKTDSNKGKKTSWEVKCSVNYLRKGSELLRTRAGPLITILSSINPSVP